MTAFHMCQNICILLSAFSRLWCDVQLWGEIKKKQ